MNNDFMEIICVKKKLRKAIAELFFKMDCFFPPDYFVDNSCILAHDVRLHIAGINEPKSAQQAKQGA